MQTNLYIASDMCLTYSKSIPWYEKISIEQTFKQTRVRSQFTPKWWTIHFHGPRVFIFLFHLLGNQFLKIVPKLSMMTPAATVATFRNTPGHLVLWKQKITKNEDFKASFFRKKFLSIMAVTTLEHKSLTRPNHFWVYWFVFKIFFESESRTPPPESEML
jgi:hypothetical protein